MGLGRQAKNAKPVEVANAGQGLANAGHVPTARIGLALRKTDAPMCRAGMINARLPGESTADKFKEAPGPAVLIGPFELARSRLRGTRQLWDLVRVLVLPGGDARVCFSGIRLSRVRIVRREREAFDGNGLA